MKELKISEELREVRKTFLPLFLIFIFLSFFFFVFGIKPISLFEKEIFLPLPSSNSISVFFFKKIKEDLLPENVQLIVLSPTTAFLGQITISFFLSFLFIFPYFLFKFFGYIFPALYQNEKKYFLKIFIPSFFLFLIGCLFSYFFLIPLTFKILYFFALPIEVVPFFELNNFLVLTFGLIIIGGILFLIPIFMALLSYFGIIEVNFWRKEWKFALLIFLLFSAIITPEGSGITQVILSFFLTLLYFLGYIISKGFKRSV